MEYASAFQIEKKALLGNSHFNHDYWAGARSG